MNNIYKVIWSKAKNCYVVASEIARSHTKSASGSEKIGGVTRRSLLASLMALSLLCGGLGVAEATVHVNEGTGVTHEVYTTGETYTQTEVNAKLDLKANATDVATNTANIANLENNKLSKADASNTYATKADVNTELAQKADKTYVDNALNDKVDKADVYSKTDADTTFATKTELNAKADATALANYATTTDVDTKLAGKADKTDLENATNRITTNEGNIAALKTKTTNLSDDGKALNGMTTVETDALKVTGEISNGAGVTTTLAKIDESMKQTETNKGDIANLKSKTDTQQTWIGRLNERTTQISYDPAKGTTVNGVDFMAAEVDAHGKGLTGVTTLNTTGDATIGGALTAAEVNAGTGAITGGSLSVIGAVNGISVNAGTLNTTGDATVGGDLSAKNTEINGTLHATGATTLDGALTAKGEAAFEKNVTMDQKLTVTGDTSLNKTDVNGALTAKGDVILGTNTAQTVTVNGIADFNEAVNMDNGLTVDKGLNVTSGESNLKNTTVDGTLSVNKETTLNGKLTANDEATFKENVTMEKDLEVKGELKTDKISMKNTDTDPDGTIHRSATTITADGITHIGEVEKSGVITKSQFTHTEEGSETYAKKGDATDWTETRSDVKADGVKTEVKDSKGNRTNTSQTKEGINGFAIDEDGNSSTTSQTAKDINGNVTDKDGNKTDMKVTATENSIQIQDKDGKNTNLQVNTMGSSVTEIKNEEGKTTKTEQTATDITNTAEQGTIKNDAMNIENNASGNITNNAQNGTITNNAKDIVNNATGDMTNDVGGKLTTTVKGQATENFNSGLDTNVTGKENHTVTGDQNIHVTGKQTNEIGGDQENTIGGNQTTTVEGKVKEDYKKDLTTTVGGNELHEVTGTKTENVTGMVKENYSNGQETNVTGNQDIYVSENQTNKIDGNQVNTIGGEQTTTVEGKVKEDYKKDLTTTVGGNELHEVTGTKTENVTGMVKENYSNGQETNVTGNQDIYVSENQTNKIDGDQENTIGGNQTTNVTGNISNKAENITNEAKTSLTDKVGTSTRVTTSRSITDTVGATTNRMIEDGKITDYAGDSTVTTEKDKGTTFTKRGSMAYRDGGPTDTNISGNTITTGKVTMDYAEVMKDLGVHGNAKVDQNLEVTGTSTLKGDVTMESNATVKKDLKVEGTTTTKTLKVTENAEIDGTLKVAKKATFEDSVSIAKDLSVGGDVTANSYKVGDKTYISAAGINANDQKITNVADGSISEGSKDAVNGGQLYGVKRDLEHQVDKVGANAAAMANLRPMEFDPSSKWNIAAAIGNYGSETAAAIGAFYRPNDNVMVNLSTAFGTGENMVGGGVSVRLGKGGNKLSREETNALKAQVADLTARMDALLSVLNPNMSKDFPDVPENHWAYEAVSRLAGNDIVQGYPDGEFHGERTMTRYEMAEIIYNALSRGAEAERELVEEFKPELQAMAASEKSTAEKAEG